MTEVDAAIILISLFSCFFGLWRGVVKEFFSLLTWIAASVLARIYCASLAEFLVDMIESSNIRSVTAFLLIFIMIILWGALLNHYLAKLITIAKYENADRLIGGVFGIAKSGVIVMVSLYLSNTLEVETERWQQSLFMPYALSAVEWSEEFVGIANSFDQSQ